MHGWVTCATQCGDSDEAFFFRIHVPFMQVAVCVDMQIELAEKAVLDTAVAQSVDIANSHSPL